MICKNDLISFTVSRNNKVCKALVVYKLDNKYAIDYLGLKLDIDRIDTLIIEDLEGYTVEAEVIDINDEDGVALIEVIDGIKKPKRVQVSIGAAIKYEGDITNVDITEVSKQEMVLQSDKVLQTGKEIAGIIKYDKVSIKFKGTVIRSSNKEDNRVYLVEYRLANQAEYHNIDDIFNNYLLSGRYSNTRLRR